MKARYLTFLGLFSMAQFALISCSDAIFATIETERKTATNSLSLTLSIFDIAVPVPGTYCVAAGGVFQGIYSLANGVAWTPNINDNSRPYNPSGAVCNAMSLFGGVLYGGFVTSSGSPSLYQSDGTYSFGNGRGTLITSTAAPGEQVTLLRSAGPVVTPYLFMGGTTGTTGLTFELDYSSNGTVWTATNLTGLPYPISGVGWDGTNYWAASQANVYTSLNPASNFVPPPINPVPSNDQVNGVFADSANGRVFLATKLNGIYWLQEPGTSWNHISPDQQGSVTVSYLCVTGPVGTDSSGNIIYLAGSDGYGYYTVAIPPVGPGGMSRFGDSTILLFTSSVSRIAWDSANSNVLMGTNANGLWRGVFDSTGALASGQSWTHE
jgi:hypothetical protein